MGVHERRSAVHGRDQCWRGKKVKTVRLQFLISAVRREVELWSKTGVHVPHSGGKTRKRVGRGRIGTRKELSWDGCPIVVAQLGWLPNINSRVTERMCLYCSTWRLPSRGIQQG